MKKQENRVNTMGSRVRAARESMNFSQSDLAEKLGFQSATAVSLIENGERNISSVLLERIAVTLHRDVKYFLGQPEKTTDVRVALRADKDLTAADKEAILRFIDLAKRKKDAKQ